MTARVLTVILNYKTPEMTLRAAAAARTAMAEIDGEIVIVDNASDDGSDAALRAGTAGWPSCRVVQTGHNGGYGAGNNVGIRAGLSDGTAPDFVYLLNSDAFPDPDAIVQLRDHLLAHPDCGFVGSQLRGPDGDTHVTAFRFPSVLSEFEGAARTGAITRLLRRHVVPMGVPDGATRIDWTAGASLMLRRAALDRVGLFDERFFLYFEETDLCHRIAAAGYTGTYLPASRVVHVGSASTGMKTHARTPRFWFDSRALYFTKRGGRAYAAAATLAHLAGAGVWKLRRLVERKEERIAPYFLRDLVTCTLQSLRGRAIGSARDAAGSGG